MHQVLYHIFHRNNYDLNQVHEELYFSIIKISIRKSKNTIGVFQFTSNASIKCVTSNSSNLFPIKLSITTII